MTIHVWRTPAGYAARLEGRCLTTYGATPEEAVGRVVCHHAPTLGIHVDDAACSPLPAESVVVTDQEVS